MKQKEMQFLIEEEGEQVEKTGRVEVRKIEEEAAKTKENIEKLICMMGKYESDISSMDL